MPSNGMAVVCYEDRPECLTGVKFLALSLAMHSPKVPIYFYSPRDKVTEAFRRWVDRRAPQVQIRDVPLGCPAGWSAKPFILREALERECETAVWIDADILVTDDIEPSARQTCPKPH